MLPVGAELTLPLPPWVLSEPSTKIPPQVNLQCFCRQPGQ